METENKKHKQKALILQDVKKAFQSLFLIDVVVKIRGEFSFLLIERVSEAKFWLLCNLIRRYVYVPCSN